MWGHPGPNPIKMPFAGAVFKGQTPDCQSGQCLFSGTWITNIAPGGPSASAGQDGSQGDWRIPGTYDWAEIHLKDEATYPSPERTYYNGGNMDGSDIGTETHSFSLPSITIPPTPTPTPTTQPAQASASFGGILVPNNNNGFTVYDSTGTVLRTLNVAGSVPRWSPDGSKIAFMSMSPYRGSIKVINADGTGEYTVVSKGTNSIENLGSWGSTLDWSPDGNQITFIADQRLWKVNIDGSNVTKLIDSCPWAIHPRWAPDNSAIYFEHNTSCTGLNGIYSISPNGGAVTSVITYEDLGGTQLVVGHIGANPSMDFSRDSSKLLIGTRGGGCNFNNNDGGWKTCAYIVDLNSSNGSQRTLIGEGTNPTTNFRNPVWSPNEDLVAFVSDGIYISNLDGTNATKIIPESALLNASNNDIWFDWVGP